VLLKACLNGGTTRDTHPSVPKTPAERAADRAHGRRGLASGWPDRRRGGSLYAAGDASIPARQNLLCHARPRRLEA
jgi:hypothetical protein